MARRSRFSRFTGFAARRAASFRFRRPSGGGAPIVIQAPAAQRAPGRVRRFLGSRNGGGIGSALGDGLALAAGVGLSIGYDLVTESTATKVDDNPYFSAGVKSILGFALARWVPRFKMIGYGVAADGMGSSTRKALFQRGSTGSGTKK